MITNEKKQDLIAALDTAGYDVVTLSDSPQFTMPGSANTNSQISVTLVPKA